MYIKYLNSNLGIKFSFYGLCFLFILASILMVVMSYKLKKEKKNGNQNRVKKLGLIAIVISIFLISCAVTLFKFVCNTDKNITAISNEQKIIVNGLPNEKTIEDIYKFVDKNSNREIETIKTNETKYIKNNTEEKYIIVDKVNYKVEQKWYYDKKEIKEINNKIVYVLKEVHY